MLKSIVLLVIAILIIDTVILGFAFVQQTGKITAVDAKIAGLQGEISTLTGESLALRRNISVLQAGLAQSEAKSLTLQAGIAQSEARSNSLQDSLNKAKLDLSKVLSGVIPPPQIPALDLLSPAAFVTSDLKINEPHLQTADIGTVTVNVTNTGGQTGTYPVVLNINGQTFATKTITLEGGKSGIVSFGVNQDRDTRVVISIDNLSLEALWETN